MTCAARVDPALAGYWLDDTECSNAHYRWDANGFVYTGESRCTQTARVHGCLVKNDATTGAVVAQRSAAVEDFLPNAAAGSLWTADFDASTLQRVELF